MNSDDKLSADEVVGALTLGALVAGPFALAFALLGLFFRAPLAAFIGAGFTALLALIGTGVLFATIQDAHPLAAVAFMFGAVLVGAFACFGLLRLMPAFFNWECVTIRLMLTRGGAVGRVGYMVVQLLPSVVIVALIVAMLFDLEEVGQAVFTQGGTPNLNFFLWIAIFGWLGMSQFAVLRFHRALHPVGAGVTFSGHAIPARLGESVTERDAA